MKIIKKTPCILKNTRKETKISLPTSDFNKDVLENEAY